MTNEYHPRILMSKAWATANPAIVDGLHESADIELFDLFDTAQTLGRLSGMKIDVVIGTIGWIDLMSVYAILLSRVGTEINYIACQMDSNIELPAERQHILGVCATAPKDATASQWKDTVNSLKTCSGHGSPHVPYTERLIRKSSFFSSSYFNDFDEQIMTLVAEGYTNPEIADVLHYASQTIRNRVSAILNESGCRNRTELASAWNRHRISEVHHRIATSAPDSSA